MLITTKDEIQRENVSNVCSVWNIEPSTEYYISRLSDGKRYLLSHVLNNEVSFMRQTSYLSEEDLVCLFDEKDVFYIRMALPTPRQPTLYEIKF